MKIPGIVSCSPLGGHRLRVAFDDGISGEVDVRTVVRPDGIFAPLADAEFAGRATVDPDLGTLTWPGGLDVDPLVLYAAVAGRPIESLLADAPASAS